MEEASVIVPPQSLAMQTGGAFVLSNPEKAAVILALLGADYAGPVVQKIEDKHLRTFMNALENLTLIPRESILAAVADFITELSARRGGLRGGHDAARQLAESLFEKERAVRLFGAAATKPVSSAESVWPELKKRKDIDIAKYLSAKQSEVVSIILSQFSTDRAGEILAELPQDVSVACVRQLSRDTTIDIRTIEAVAELVQIEFLNEESEGDAPSSVAFVSEILGILPRERRDMMLETLEKADPAQAERIRKGMMTFEDLPKRLPTTAIPIIFKDFEKEKLLIALKAGGEQEPATIEFLFANISQRMAGQYKEQIEEIKDISQKESDNAISSLMSFIGKLEKEGRITFIKPVSEDAQV
ncbi:hypothetical protein N9W89_08470 [Hellea sp.]|nr:hypothetical protein [Hellea sp.]